MPRFGQNPMRWVQEVHFHERVTFTTIVYIPFLEGYWRQSLDILKLFLQSLRQSTRLPFDLMVFDNGSCEEIQDYLIELRRQGIIQILILAQHNLGKVGAWNYLFSAAPGEFIAYADSDLLFLPGWLEASLDVFNTFPAVGMVTAQPARRGHLHCVKTLGDIKGDTSLEVKQGELLSEKYIQACRIGLGRSEKEYKEIINGQEDILISKGLVSAYVSADHFQFLTKKDILKSLLPFKVTRPLASDDDYQLDAKMDSAGFWRLSTAEYFVHHIGNRFPDSSIDLDWVFKDNEILNNGEKGKSDVKRDKNWLLSSPNIRNMLKRLNAWTYRLLYLK